MLSDDHRRLDDLADERMMFGPLSMRGESMERVRLRAARAASSKLPVLIEGEPGVGKKTLARAIHAKSTHISGPFVEVDCRVFRDIQTGGMPSSPGTDAGGLLLQKFEEAAKGTLFLEDVGALPQSLQSELLESLKQREIGTSRNNPSATANVRLIAATSDDLIQLVAAGKFREDLYYRLGVFPIFLPPLRARLDTLEHLTMLFAIRFAEKAHHHIERIDGEAVALLQRYSWPGNVRELEEVVARAVSLNDGPIVTREAFHQIGGLVGDEPPSASARSRQALDNDHPARKRQSPSSANITDPAPQHPSKYVPFSETAAIAAIDSSGHMRTLDEIEAEVIRCALERYRGHLTEVAKRLKIGRTTLYRKIRSYGLEHHVFNCSRQLSHMAPAKAATTKLQAMQRSPDRATGT